MTNEAATAPAAQDVIDVIEQKLYGPADVNDELEDDHDEEVLDDGKSLPEDDDSDSDGEGSDEEVVDESEELTLADYLGIDEDRIIVNEDGSVAVNAIIDGETKPVDLKDLVKSYQLQGHVNNESVALSNERKEFETVKSSVAAQMKAQLDDIEALSKVVEQELVSEFNSIDWAKLRVQDPAEWSAMRQQYADRANRIQQVQNLVLEEGRRQLQEQQQRQSANMQAHLQVEMNKMIQDNPDWADAKKLEIAQAELRTFLSGTYGFNDQEMALVTDHRLMKLIQDAKKFRDGTSNAEKKIQKKVPQFKKSGIAKTNAASLEKARAVKAKKSAFKSSGSVKDAAALLESRM